MMCSAICLLALSFGSGLVKSDSGSGDPTTASCARAGTARKPSERARAATRLLGMSASFGLGRSKSRCAAWPSPLDRLAILDREVSDAHYDGQEAAAGRF